MGNDTIKAYLDQNRYSGEDCTYDALCDACADVDRLTAELAQARAELTAALDLLTSAQIVRESMEAG